MKPSPESQLVFLSKLQRLFAEGDFTATYKFALLIALADLAVELGEIKQLFFCKFPESGFGLL